MKKVTIGFFITVFLLLVAIAWVGYRLKKGKTKTGEQMTEAAVPVVVLEVKNQAIEDVIDLTGYIDPKDTVNVTSKIAGRFTKKVVDKGTEVKKNQVIAYVTREDVGVQFEPFAVQSPISGVVAKFLFDPGTMVSPQFPVAVVVDIDQVAIKTSVIEKDYAKVKVSQLAKIYTDAYPDRWFEGKVFKIAPTLDQESHTAEIEIRIPNKDHQLKPGMFVNVSLVVARHENVPVIPKTVIAKRLGKDVAFVVNGNVVDMRELTLGYYDLNNYEVLNGLKPGELVVAENLAIIQNGIKVSVARKIDGDQAKEAEQAIPAPKEN